MITPDRQTVNMRVHVTYPIDNVGDERYVALRIEDVNAAVRVVEMDIPFADWTLIQSGSSVEVEATVRALDKVGKVMEHASTPLGYGATAADVASVVDRYESEGWESVKVDRTNQGKRVVARRWVDAAEQRRGAS